MIYEIKYAQYLSLKRSLLIEINRIKSLDPEKVRDIPYCATSPTVTLSLEIDYYTKPHSIPLRLSYIDDDILNKLLLDFESSRTITDQDK
jgi:hypothetical protein